MMRIIAIIVPAMIPITRAVFSAASDDILSRFFVSPEGRKVDLGGSGCNISGYSVLVVVVVVITKPGVDFVLPVV